jgi:hypothetical protein
VPCALLLCHVTRRYLDRANNPLRRRYTDYISMRGDVLGKAEDVDLKAPVVICEMYGPSTAAVLGAIRAVAVSGLHLYCSSKGGILLWYLACGLGWHCGRVLVEDSGCVRCLRAFDHVRQCRPPGWCAWRWLLSVAPVVTSCVPAACLILSFLSRSPTVALLTSCWAPATRARDRRSCTHR